VGLGEEVKSQLFQDLYPYYICEIINNKTTFTLFIL
jgi:hypothetical protein